MTNAASPPVRAGRLGQRAAGPTGGWANGRLGQRPQFARPYPEEKTPG